MPFLIRHSWLAAFFSICRCSKCLNQRMLGEGAFEIICSDLLFQGPEAPKPNAGRGSTTYWWQGWDPSHFLALSLGCSGGCPSLHSIPRKVALPPVPRHPLPVVLYQYQAAWQISKPCSGASHTSPVSKTGEPRLPLDILYPE